MTINHCTSFSRRDTLLALFGLLVALLTVACEAKIEGERVPLTTDNPVNPADAASGGDDGSDAAAGSPSDDDASLEPPVQPRCPNGKVEAQEECDDGNRANGDGCDVFCRLEECGNGAEQDGEECDDGNALVGDGCDANCRLEVCGNHVEQNGEECDDGNTLDGDGCDSACQQEPRARCTNGVLEAAEECDDGNRTNGDGCDVRCHLEACGNGVVDEGEECDDENTIAGDGCSPTCTGESGVLRCVRSQCACATLDGSDCCSEAVPYRAEILDGLPTQRPLSPVAVTRTRQDVWQQFGASCGTAGTCHVGPGDPLAASPVPFKFEELSFAERPGLAAESLERITSGNEFLAMPQGLGTGAQRACGDVYYNLGHLLRAWEASGFLDSFSYLPCGQAVEGDEVTEVSGSCAAADDPYLVSADLGAAQTSLGTCIPLELPDTSSICTTDDLRAKDAVFAAIADSENLPDTLRATDLVSLDSAVLAHHRVFSYAPTYTLFSDHAKKQRYVRMPIGEVARFNPETNDFDIPDNTRFYKTFLKRVVDADGRVGFRKMETRLIVVRNAVRLPDGNYEQRALRATYVWDQDEQTAMRLKDPLRNGKPWRDRLCPYVTEEASTRDPAANPIIDNVSTDCTYMTSAELEDPHSGLIRHYALPSAERCDQCHMGSNNHSYILGFIPWQVDLPPPGEGQLYDEPHPDQADQLERLAFYGLLEGISPGDAKLSESQGFRTPRNPHELKAQGYMLGNCAYCHNPDGFPSVQNELLETFNMFPKSSGPGGIFQFPLDKQSRRARRKNLFPLSYLSAQFGNGGVGTTFTPKTSEAGFGQLLAGRPEASPEADPEAWNEWGYPDVYVDPQQPSAVVSEFTAPWNSLIWRNVYSPFTWEEDEGIFIHMPRHVPGYDCRAHRIMANWMLSIPVDPASPTQELEPEDPGYDAALVAANERVAAYNSSLMGGHCPDDDDILDPAVLRKDYAPPGFRGAGAPMVVPIDLGYRHETGVPEPDRRIDPLADKGLYFQDGIPDHAHWISVDTTSASTTWVPRRSDWKSVLSAHTDERDVDVSGLSPEATAQALLLQRNVMAVRGIELAFEREEFSLQPLPMGPWKGACAPAQDTPEQRSSPTLAELRREKVTTEGRWVERLVGDEFAIADSAQIHHTSRGESVFRAICQNCHGENYDSQSPLAVTIGEFTNGETRVADFRRGLLGPANAAGLFAQNEFTFTDGNIGGTPEEWQARYMVFMGLGGTLAFLPQVVVNAVSGSAFYGRVADTGASATSALSGNMLESAIVSCDRVLGLQWQYVIGPNGSAELTFDLGQTARKFVPRTGHYELWESLCQYNNEVPIRVLVPPAVPAADRIQGQDYKEFARGLRVFRSRDRGGNALYPSEHPVGTQYGLFNRDGEIERGIKPGNTMPWCIGEQITPVNSQKDIPALLEHFRSLGLADKEMPICPDSLFDSAFDVMLHEIPRRNASGADERSEFDNFAFREEWLRQGAMNAGVAAYYYLDRRSKGLLAASPEFDACATTQ